MNKRRCMACGRFFRACPKVRDQQYCSEPTCQKVRKRRWQKKKRVKHGVRFCFL